MLHISCSGRATQQETNGGLCLSGIHRKQQHSLLTAVYSIICSVHEMRSIIHNHLHVALP